MMKKKSSIVWIVVVVVLAAVLLGTWGLAAKTSADNFCTACHAYERVSWDHGSHSHVNCISCHTKGTIKDKTSGMRKVYLTLTGQVDPHRGSLPSYPESIQANCVACHMSEEKLAQNPSFKTNHDAYLQMVPDCISCHDIGHNQKLKNLRSPGARPQS